MISKRVFEYVFAEKLFRKKYYSFWWNKMSIIDEMTGLPVKLPFIV